MVPVAFHGWELAPPGLVGGKQRSCSKYVCADVRAHECTCARLEKEEHIHRRAVGSLPPSTPRKTALSAATLKKPRPALTKGAWTSSSSLMGAGGVRCRAPSQADCMHPPDIAQVNVDGPPARAKNTDIAPCSTNLSVPSRSHNPTGYERNPNV